MNLLRLEHAVTLELDVSDNQRDVRREYGSASLVRADLHADPLQQFDAWLGAATRANLMDATAMTLATVDPDGRPSTRIVLLKHFDREGYVWYTDYGSQKGRDLAANANASVLFYWRELERQVRIDGVVSKVERALSEQYFNSRPQDSRYSAAASRQSQPVAKREHMEQAVAGLQAQYPAGEVPVPPDWGGYRLHAQAYEFWQGRVGRLHDRFRYQPMQDAWRIERLQP